MKVNTSEYRVTTQYNTIPTRSQWTGWYKIEYSDSIRKKSLYWKVFYWEIKYFLFMIFVFTGLILAHILLWAEDYLVKNLSLSICTKTHKLLPSGTFVFISFAQISSWIRKMYLAQTGGTWQVYNRLHWDNVGFML